ncbi:hypothetical protein ON058_08260 [Demequina sp. B12]|uniref:hypothetical protein n=1 Tax=Demequina sp. B12 TaxID=2992757 RepID=UPI00237A936D|nr:hypothetical protein [Demequina sp. B12]MDE0573407.1 hypothetical protein [Demequina sp. B12]
MIDVLATAYGGERSRVGIVEGRRGGRGLWKPPPVLTGAGLPRSTRPTASGIIVPAFGMPE